MPATGANPSSIANAERPAVGSCAGCAQMAYRRPFRRYQRLALDAFERARGAGRSRCYVVLPPGAGKTVLGLEIVRRLGRPALVLCPNTAVQAQWLGQWQEFTPALVPAGPDATLSTPLTVLTYQALCNFGNAGDGAAALDEQALALWRATLQRQREFSEEQAAAEIERLAGAGGERYREELQLYRRRTRHLIARGGERADLLALLHPHGRELVERLRAARPLTLVLDECHHLLEMWGALVRAVLDEVGQEVFVVGLTATPPEDMDAREAALYQDLFGVADLVVPAPAVVKEGDLAPYQELAYLTLPLEHEARYIAEQHRRFQELTLRLLEPDFGSVSFVAWLRRRVGERRTRQGAQVSWTRFEQDEPALAQAALRFFFHGSLELPEGARLRERHRRPPDAADWVAMIEDYCLGALKASADPRDVDAWQAIRQALPSLGYVLTSQGIRACVSPVDRVLALSAGKARATLEILGAERQALGERLRALVLCDYERAGRDVVAKLRGVLDPQAGSAALLLHILLADAEVARLNPVLVTGRTVACSRAAAVDLGAWIEEQAPELRGTVATARLFEPAREDASTSWDDVVVVKPDHPSWQPRRYVPLVTRYFEEGRCRCLVGTRGLLGEGWDATTVNVLVDLTAAGTSTAVHQMRGRSLRLDPNLPRKVADNWDVVCVAPEHPKGTGDYARFVRKHRHYYAPTADGEIESGVSHVHADLSPYGPPPSSEFAEINAGMLSRAAEREQVYARWQVGTPYEDKEVPTVRIHLSRAVGLPNRRLLRRAAAAGAAILVALGVAAGHVLLAIAGLVLAVAAGVAAVARAISASLRRLSPSDALEDFAAAVADGLRAAGVIGSSLSAKDVRTTVQSDGSYRCYLAGASSEEGQVFADALDEVLSPLGAPRYVVPRYVADPPASAAAALRLLAWQALGAAAGKRVVYHAVPAVLATNRRRVAAFAGAWNRHVGAGWPITCQSEAGQAIVETYRGENPFGTTTQLRTLWR